MGKSRVPLIISQRCRNSMEGLRLGYVQVHQSSKGKPIKHPDGIPIVGALRYLDMCNANHGLGRFARWPVLICGRSRRRPAGVLVLPNGPCALGIISHSQNVLSGSSSRTDIKQHCRAQEEGISNRRCEIGRNQNQGIWILPGQREHCRN